MINWVYWRARQSRSLDWVIVATDAEELFTYCRQHDIPVSMTSAAHRSGTDRLVEVMEHEPADVYLNIQSDEPMITPEHIELLLLPFRELTDTQVTTLKVPIALEEARDPNNVKVVTDASGRALYFSRALSPHDRDGSGEAQYFKHLGLYGYSAQALRRFSQLPASDLERFEKLEQLRFLEHGIPIRVVQTLADTIGVDTAEDLRKVEEYFQRLGTRPRAG
jgi:3-deoxy-manno-octulosonate cytidylyltransferase (CMP-KDO synthetase)